MKKVIFMMAIMLATFVGANAQKTQNEGYVGYSFLRQDVTFNRTPTVKYNADTDSNGLAVGYTRYTAGSKGKVGDLGVTGEVAVNFGSNDASLATVMVGGVAKARNLSYVQPFVRVMGGLARQHVNRANIIDNSDLSFAVDAGVGADVSLGKGSRYAVRFSGDLVNSGFHSERNTGARINLGLVF